MKSIWTVFVVISIVSEISCMESVESSTTSDGERDNGTLCTRAKCVMKCCPLGKYVTSWRYAHKRERICGAFNHTTADFGSFVQDNFHAYPEISKIEEQTVKAGIFETNVTFKAESMNVFGYFNLHLTEVPDLYLEYPNAYERWTRIPNDRFCWDYTIVRSRRGSNKSLTPGIWIVWNEPEYLPSRTSITLQTSAMLVSCFFLLIVLVVYAVLPELRTLSGRILMAYVGSLFSAFLLLAVMRLDHYYPLGCRILSFLVYYFFMASFCWTNVMSYDIWWTSRGYDKSRSFRRGVCFSFLVYCLYAFGLPLALTIVLIVLNEIDLSHMPWFVTPKIAISGCFLTGGEQFLYMYIPMLILILCNWVFYIMTAVNVWNITRATDSKASKPYSQRSHQNRFCAILKLSVVLGLNWVVEIVSYMQPGYTILYISDYFNLLSGVFIFLIFVGKRNILRKLMKKCRPGQNAAERTSCSSEVEGYETQKLNVCA